MASGSLVAMAQPQASPEQLPPPPEPSAVTVTLIRPDLPPTPEPQPVTVKLTRPDLPPTPEPHSVTVTLIRPDLPPTPEPHPVTVTLIRPDQPPPPEPLAITVTISRPEVDDDESEQDQESEEDAWQSGAREDVEEAWQEGARADTVDPCRGSRPEYEGALLRIQAALRGGEIDPVLAELRSGLLTPHCPGDRERLEALRGAGIQLAQAEADAKAARMNAAVRGANEAAARRAAILSGVLTTINQIVDEYQQAAASTPTPTGGTGATSVAASAGGATDGCNVGTYDLKADPDRGRTYFLVRWDNGSYLVTSWPSPASDDERRECGSELGCVKAIMLDPADQGYQVIGQYAAQAAALAEADRRCGG